MNNFKFSIVLFFIINLTFSQEYHPKTNGVKTPKHTTVAFINATIHINPSQVLEGATLLIKNNKIVSVGIDLKVPNNTQTIDLSGKSIYPSFIDLYSNFGLDKPKAIPHQKSPQYDANRKGYYWNDHIRPETNSFNSFKYDNKKAKELLKVGFGIVNTHVQDAIISGTGTLVVLDQNGNTATQVIEEKSAQYFSFDKSKLSKQSYPSSIMGSMALIRQVHHDANWYEKGNIETTDLALEAFIANKNRLQIFKAGNWLNDLRIDKLGDEFGVNYIIVGGGDEYQRIKNIKQTNTTYILPLNFPKAYDVENPFQASKISLKDMKHWNLAPTNPSVFTANEIPFTLTTYQLKSVSDFKTNLQKAIKYGLNKEAALAALTTVPAKLLGKSDKIGSLKKGAYANFMITSGDIFDSKTTLYEHWIMGHKNSFENMSIKEINGDYDLAINGKTYKLNISGKANKLKSKLKKDTIKLTSKLTFKEQWLTIHFAEKDAKEYTRLIAKITKEKTTITGKAVLTDGSETSFTATYLTPKDKKEDKKEDKNTTPTLVKVSYPNMAYGFKTAPKQESFLFKNVTVWTNEKEGILKNIDVLIKNGKIEKIGKNIVAKKATLIDGTGKHLTSGIIDEHSHIATSSVNEGGQNSSAEVTIEDVVKSNDINIYRNLAGGVTTIQILHGSANPIGGRSALVKLKWGETPDKMLIPNAPKYIKFALGENVKQSNWNSRSRFPQTRMGVEQVYIDYFTRAKAYDTKKKSGVPYRKDDELETIAEILNKERFITCHSYVQSEINMLMKVAEKFNFNINTFTHILEGYKVADKMKKHGVGGSTFSDWWAYKYEVNDAIPYNGAIMHNQGITVAFNSDDSEMSRRLNQEAAKAVKYGDLSEEDAWKFVTLNPAKLLHLDDKIGSIKVGKDADVVLWNTNPLSVYAKAEKTLIEGVVYFDLARDLKLRTEIKKERNELINLMLDHKNNGGKTQTPKKEEKPHMHCDFVGDYQ
ncbi:MAG: amidohydrolase family protein [Flavobacteriaceae bacterium]|nr:amidohydrolase family protein [Flavobacteriaceae bacterium]